MPWTTEYIPFDESGYARLNSVRFARSNPQTISVGEGTEEIPGSWLVGDPEQLYPQLAPLIAQRRSADADGRARYDAAFNEGTSNSYQGLDAPNFYQELVKGGMTPEKFVEDWANTFPADQRSHAPELVTGADGKKYVKYDQHDSKGGLLDKITSLAEPAFALSGSYGLGELAAGLGTALSAGAGEALGIGAAGLTAAEEAAMLTGSLGAGSAATGGAITAGTGLIPGISQAEALAYVKDARDAIEAISRLAEVGGSSAEAGAAALGFSGADAALQNLVPSMLNAAANGVPGGSSSLPNTPPTSRPKDIKDWLKTANNAVGLGSAIGALGEAAGNSGDDPFESIRADEKARQERITKSVADIRGQFGKFDDNYLKGVSSSYLDYYLPQFNEQAKEARRQTAFNTPSAGTSAFARRAGQLETDIGRQEANIRSQAQAQAQSQKAKLANQEETLISQAEGAGGIADASARAASAADIASTPQPFSPLGQLFATYTGNVANAAQAERQGYAPTGIVPNIFSRPGGRQPVQYVGG